MDRGSTRQRWPLLVAALIAHAEIAEGATDRSLEERVRKLEETLRNVEEEKRALRESLEELKQAHEDTASKVQSVLPLQGKFFGYADVGLFYVQGNGSGIRSDFGHQIYPEYSDIAEGWVFYGDPLSTAINSRGEPADLDTSRAIGFDPIHNEGKASFILNAINFGVFSSIGSDLTLNLSIDFLPRARNVSRPGLALGDFIDAKLGYLEYTVPIEKFELKLYAGKFDSVLGIEYRSQNSPDRLTVTPSLICRYTCGRPIGVKARGRFFDDNFIVALAVTNGTSFIEQFAFANEIDTNFFKTGSLRLSYRFPVGAGLEIGASGAFGAQDFQTREGVYQWHAGGDIHLEWHDLEIMGEFVIGRATGATGSDGTTCGAAPCLRYHGAYGLVGYRITNWLTPYVRVDWRDAVHRDGLSFVYVTSELRATAGLHFEIGTHIIVKVEYTHNHELGRQPQFNNDVATSALVVKY